MPLTNTQNLFVLIKSLSKGEKRAFRLSSTRHQEGEDSQYLQLFDLLEKSKKFDEEEVRAKLNPSSLTAYSNLKSRLYDLIMLSLRQVHREKYKGIKLREYIDFAYLLYGRGLHLQALEVLEKAKLLSQKHYNDFALITIMEFEKTIQSRHITRSKSLSVANMIEESQAMSDKIMVKILLSNIRLKLHQFYVEKGHVSNEKEAKFVETTFGLQFEQIDQDKLDGIEYVYFLQACVWYHYILDDFQQCMHFAMQWVEAFKKDKSLQSRDVDLFMRGYHYVLTSAFHIKDNQVFEIYLKELENFRTDNYQKFNLNSQIISFQYVHNGRMNRHFLNGTFSDGEANIAKTKRRLERYKDKIDIHKVMVMYYKIAWMYLCTGKHLDSIHYLTKIIEMTDASLRRDIQAYARLMLLMNYYDIELFELLELSIKDAKRYLKKMDSENKMQWSLLKMIDKLIDVPLLERKKVLNHHLQQMVQWTSDRLMGRSFAYLDGKLWIEHKLSGSNSIEEYMNNYKK